MDVVGLYGWMMLALRWQDERVKLGVTWGAVAIPKAVERHNERHSG